MIKSLVILSLTYLSHLANYVADRPLHIKNGSDLNYKGFKADYIYFNWRTGQWFIAIDGHEDISYNFLKAYWNINRHPNPLH